MRSRSLDQWFRLFGADLGAVWYYWWFGRGGQKFWHWMVTKLKVDGGSQFRCHWPSRRTITCCSTVFISIAPVDFRPASSGIGFCSFATKVAHAWKFNAYANVYNWRFILIWLLHYIEDTVCWTTSSPLRLAHYSMSWIDEIQLLMLENWLRQRNEDILLRSGWPLAASIAKIPIFNFFLCSFCFPFFFIKKQKLQTEKICFLRTKTWPKRFITDHKNSLPITILQLFSLTNEYTEKPHSSL